jgi:hypothetical protein
MLSKSKNAIVIASLTAAEAGEPIGGAMMSSRSYDGRGERRDVAIGRLRDDESDTGLRAATSPEEVSHEGEPVP